MKNRKSPTSSDQIRPTGYDEPDPFEEASQLQVLRRTERGTYVEQTMGKQNSVKESAYLPEAMTSLPETSDPLQPVIIYGTRISELSDDLSLNKLEDYEGMDLVLYRYDKYHSAENDADFFTLEVALVSDPESRFLVNCGGQTAMRKIEQAFQKVELQQAVPPLIACFTKVLTSSGRSFWVIS